MIASKKLCLAICLLIALAGAGDANAKAKVATMKEGAAIEAPWGFVDFCRRHSNECSSTLRNAHTVPLTSRRIAQLAVVQTVVNKRVSYATDDENYGRREYWAYPGTRGDCEDFAIEKRRRLVALGWPRSALLLTAARMRSGRKHLVLVVVTDKGEFVLDNSSRNIRHWKSMNYQWLARQSRFNESSWVALDAIETGIIDANENIAAR